MFELAADDLCNDSYSDDDGDDDSTSNKIWTKAMECAKEAATTHFLLGIPSHVLAAASLLVAVTSLQSKPEEKISNLVGLRGRRACYLCKL